MLFTTTVIIQCQVSYPFRIHDASPGALQSVQGDSQASSLKIAWLHHITKSLHVKANQAHTEIKRKPESSSVESIVSKFRNLALHCKLRLGCQDRAERFTKLDAVCLTDPYAIDKGVTPTGLFPHAEVTAAPDTLYCGQSAESRAVGECGCLVRRARQKTAWLEEASTVASTTPVKIKLFYHYLSFPSRLILISGTVCSE